MLASLPLSDLAQRCAEQTQRYIRRQDNDPLFCFELFRRALAEGAAEAFTLVCQVYQPLVLRWVQRHTGFERTGETADYFANAALGQFYFALHGPKFAGFHTLGQVLQYLKLCVFSTVAQYLRDQARLELAPLEAAAHAATGLSSSLEAADLWREVCRVLPGEREQRLARAVFVLGLKPRQVLEALPGQFRSEREITVLLHAMRRRLRQDAVLRAWLGGGSGDGV